MQSENNKTNSMNSGLSLVEILVVMLVMIVVSTLGFKSIDSFRKGTELNSASTQFNSTVQLVRNSARNNVVSRTYVEDPESTTVEDMFESRFEGYFLHFMDTKTFVVRSCTYDSVNNKYNCEREEPTLSISNPDISVEVVAGDCVGVLYKSLSAEMVIIRSAGFDVASFSPSDIPSCKIRLKHKTEPDDSTREIFYLFDSQANEFKISKKT